MNRQWSYSSLSQFEKCPYQYYLSKVAPSADEFEEEPHPAARRGTEIHEACEQYLLNNVDELPELVHSTFSREFEVARENSAEAEYSFAFDPEWNATDWETAWCRGKIDMLIRDQDLVVDFKTGKYYSNHREQASLYALAAMQLDLVEDAHVEFWYFDLDQVETWLFKRSNLDNLRDSWAHRAQKLEDELSFDPRPGAHCRWCPHSYKKGGQCSEG